jgi:hypothetical protein
MVFFPGDLPVVKNDDQKKTPQPFGVRGLRCLFAEYALPAQSPGKKQGECKRRRFG